ncbi:PTS sugar transporter subunit IIB [uncultured Clostridium sp.]|jgi:PTS system cellobiose-specific IIB component|uniref:PTS sugar transporter subunit IIB n=1 Tax=uncultured Clostridium sp. TaxID=59620 RepID=UPI002601EBAD|nr:PTS sugar transporter subunit IIB [uncultured Clostridium sp.]
MKKILLVCSAGMSTSLLVSKMKISAKKKGIECIINAIAESEIEDYERDIDVLLLGPQVRFLFNKLKGKFSVDGIPVSVINTVDYGTMNGAKVLKHALDLIEEQK